MRTTDGSWHRRFDISPFARCRLLNGFDDIGMALAYEPDIEAFEQQRPALLPTTTAD